MTAPRELTIPANQMVHPEWIKTPMGNRRAWIEPEVKEIIDLMHHGDPTLGWPGDPRLALYRTQDKRWELWRLEADGEYRMVMRSKPGTKLDRGLITNLVLHDVRRGYDPFKDAEAHNERRRAKARKSLSEQAEQVADRLAYGLRRDGV